MAKFITLDNFKAGVAKLKEKFLTKAAADQLYLTSNDRESMKSEITSAIKEEMATELESLVQTAVQQSAAVNGSVYTSPKGGYIGIKDANGHVEISTADLQAKWIAIKG